MTVREFVRTVWDGKWYVLAAVVIVVAAAFVYLQRQVTTYQATATVELTSSQAGSGDGATSITANSDPTLVTSEPVAKAAAQELGGGVSPDAIASQITATFDPTTNTMTIQGEAPGAAGATAVTNAFATSYVAYLPTVVDKQVAAISKQLDSLTKQLNAANVALAKDKTDPIAGPTKSAITKQIQTYTAQQVSYESLSPAGRVTTAANGAVPLGLGRSSVLALSLLAGLAAGVGLAFGRRGLDFHVQTVAQAAEVADAPVLAEIDGVRRALRDAEHHGSLPVASRAATPYTESIRELRTAVQVSVERRDHVAVVVTAADPSAPRSFIAANLAASLALSGRRTIVFSADMRRPQIDTILPPPDGWSGEPRELRPTQVRNLSLFPVPDQPLDPADYLATSEARDLVDSLRAQADVVVIDAPPVLAAADATILGGYSDGVVLIASVGKTDQVVLGEAVHRLRVNNVPLAGLAVEGVTGSRRMAYAATYGDAAASTAATTAGPDAAPSVGAATAVDRPRDTKPSASAETEPETALGSGEVDEADGTDVENAVSQSLPQRAPETALPVRPQAVPSRPAGQRPAAVPPVRAARPRVIPAWSPVAAARETRMPTEPTPAVAGSSEEAEREPAADSASSGNRAAS